jgi:hypothetical protein
MTDESKRPLRAAIARVARELFERVRDTRGDGIERVRLPDIAGAAFELACASTARSDQDSDVELRSVGGATDSGVVYEGTRHEILLFLKSAGAPSTILWVARDLSNFHERQRQILRGPMAEVAAKLESERPSSARYKLPAADQGVSAWLELRAIGGAYVLEIHGEREGASHSRSRPLQEGSLEEIVRHLRAPASMAVIEAKHAMVTTYSEPLSLPPATEDEIRAGVMTAPASDWRHRIDMSIPVVRRLVNACGRPVRAATLSPQDRERARAEARMLSPGTWTFQGDVEAAGWSLVQPDGDIFDSCIVFPMTIPEKLRGYRLSSWESVAQVLDAFGL